MERDNAILVGAVQLETWLAQRGHDRCWYYPDIFARLCALVGVKVEPRGLPSRAEFEEGCRRYQEAEYGPAVSFLPQRNPHDCFNACLASLTGIPIDAFPLWTAQDSDSVVQWNAVLRVCHDHRWTLAQDFYGGMRAGNTFPRIPAGWSVGSGKSPRGEWDHSVVCYDGRPVFDPHESGAFLAGEPEEFVVPMRLAQ